MKINLIVKKPEITFEYFNDLINFQLDGKYLLKIKKIIFLLSLKVIKIILNFIHY